MFCACVKFSVFFLNVLCLCEILRFFSVLCMCKIMRFFSVLCLCVNCVLFPTPGKPPVSVC